MIDIYVEKNQNPKIKTRDGYSKKTTTTEKRQRKKYIDHWRKTKHTCNENVLEFLFLSFFILQ